MESTKQDRILEIFFRALRGEDLYVTQLANHYEVSTKSITRVINDLKAFLAEHRDLVGNTELQYSYQDKCYRLYMDEFLSSKELLAVIEVLIGTRAFSKMELLALTDKLRRFTTPADRDKLNQLIKKELYHYTEVKHDCESVQQMLWQLGNCIMERREITITYYRMDRLCKNYRLCPASVMFTDYYFYLIAYRADDTTVTPRYFRVDRIKNIVEHRQKFTVDENTDFNEGLLRQRSLLMWPGQLRKIHFEFSGPSVQAVLDKLPTAKVLESSGGKCLIEAEVYGDGIKMWLLSQGSWVKVVEPQEFVREMMEEIERMRGLYL